MGDFKELLKKIIPVNYWPAPACLLCYQAGQIIPAAYNRSVQGSKGAAPQGQAEYCVSI